jgi:formiminoglutamate deiminase
VTALWCELAWLGGPRPQPGVLLELEGERIASIAPDTETPPRSSERLNGLVIPGFANAHSHAFQRALRGRTEHPTNNGSFWTWREQMYGLARILDPDSLYALSRATFAEMALAGVTLVGEFHYLHHDRDGRPYADPNAMGEAVLEAARATGVRLTLLDACYLHGGIGVAPDCAQLRFSDRSAEQWVQRMERLEPRDQRVGAAIHSVRAVDPDSASTVADWATARRAPIHAHVSEQPAENEASLDAYGITPTELLDQAGVISERFTAVHATHVTERDVALLGGAGACCCLCPTTERDLADGIGPAYKLRQAGARLALGSDSHALIEPLEEARAVELDERLNTGIRGRHAPEDLLQAVTQSGYESLGWPEGGAIREGALADLVAVNLNSVRLAGTPPENAVQALVFAGMSADVSDVLVGGRFVVRDGAHTSLDVAQEMSHAIAGIEPWPASQ